FALMVVWGYPCESKSSPAHYSKSPCSAGAFFMPVKSKKSLRKKAKLKKTRKLYPFIIPAVVGHV
ncbi:hypothetical protein, partial [Acinetobacter sp. TSRC1-2]|uniref:hypothetical protein n=1 Tax=Acinetobacter sp. TSRC1-2 TaxID=2804664 RepID=UPI003CF552E6